MYHEEAVSIHKADDGGYIINVRVKVKKKKESKGEICCGDSRREEKILLAKDLDKVNEILAKVLPDMKKGGMEEDEFTSAFKEASKEED